ncbi:Hypothetical predicted protein [Cloeon dipterum]|uniref:Uncharacterized protein n=2 Tax=Cloeon dipterum TaxID=197152 RepID=A0A8S1E7H6_9INSE|nr:Hypothetical predicted protein [Cloeon dipterum]
MVLSLLDLTIKIVYDYIERYDEDLLKTCIGPVRHKMLEEVHRKMKDDPHPMCPLRDKKETNRDEKMEKIWAILPTLIKSTVRTKLDVSFLTFIRCNFCAWPNYRFQEFIRCLGANTPSLKELIMTGPYNLEYSLEERELASITKLKSLIILDIFRVQVALSGILDISRQCNKLKKIRANNSVTLDEVRSIPALRDDFKYVYIEALLNADLISLHMETDPDINSKKNLISMRHQPRYIQEFSLALPFAKKLQGININCTCLVETEEIVDFPHLPVVEYAWINCKGKSAHTSRCFMKRNGESLRELRLEGIHSKENMTFREIFSFCPNLQCLEFFDCNFSGNDAPVDAMQKLKRFWWCNSDIRYSDDAAAFSSILSAPLLDDLCIAQKKIDFSDNATVIARIQSREILQNLKKFLMPNRMIYTGLTIGDCILQLKRFNDLKNAIQSVCRF